MYASAERGARRFGQSLAVPDPQELADRAAELARDATTALVDMAGPQGADALKAASLLGRLIDVRDAAKRETWERHASTPLLLAAKATLDEASGPTEEPQLHDQRLYFEARAAIRDGDLGFARTTVEHLRSVLHRTPPDEWNHGNIAHHVHVLSGLLNVHDGNIDDAVEDLRRAGQVSATPQLMSFGPDLTLAWALLKLGRDEDVLAYFRAVSAFWSPQAFS